MPEKTIKRIKTPIMKKIVKIFIIAAAAFLAAEATADAQLFKNLLNKATSSTTTETTTVAEAADATANGLAAGAALKVLFKQFIADKKLDMSNLNNISNAAILTNNIKGLKGLDNKSTFYKDFVKGLISGSDNLVNETNSTSVMNVLTGLANNVDLSSLTSKAEDTASTATSALSNALSGAADKASTATENASSISSSITSILNMFKK